MLKGRANYLCRHRLELATQQAWSRGVRSEVASLLPRVQAWSATTRRGDIADLAGVGEADPVWPWVTSTRENCLGAECPRFEDCCVIGARREAQAADIVVVNHHLLMADLVLKEEYREVYRSGFVEGYDTTYRSGRVDTSRTGNGSIWDRITGRN